MKFEEFVKLIEDFVDSNFKAETDQDIAIKVDDYKGSYAKALKKLYKRLK